MFCIVHLPMHSTDQNLQGFVWKMVKKSLQLKILSCSVLLHFKNRELFPPV